MLAKLNKMKYFSILLLAAGMLFLQTSDAHAVDASYQEALFAHMLATEIGNAKHQESIEMVANVVTNRVKYYRQYDPNVNVTDVLLQKGQFVGIHRDLIGSTEQLLADIKKRCPGQWRTLLEISRAAINGTLPDRTNGALNYNKSSKRNAGETSKVTDKHCLYNDKPNCTTVNHYFYSSHLGRLKHNPKYSGGDHIGEFSEEELANITVPDSSNENPTEPDYVEPEECKTASTEQATVSADISGGGLFDAAILTNMNNMMVNIYKTLGRLYMLGHGLICYSTKVAPVEIMNVIKLVRLNYWIPGVLIYMTAFFLSMSIGMYFIDISFKLGFAVLFLPVSIGLWPFPPTKDKFLQNINIVIHNAMLFACAAIGITYAVKLIEEGVTGGAGGIEEFWQFIDSAERVQAKVSSNADEAFVSNNMENFTKRFAIDTTNILVILFCLFFAFKIVGVSVANYLNRFFGEGSLGSAEHAMHHMGTQAMGFATSHTIGAAGKWARDVAFTQAGRGLKSAGSYISSRAPNSKFQGTTSAGGGAGGNGGAGGPTPNTNGGPTGGPIPFNTEQQNK
ncbi:MAG: cell wall hydrolase, partial [Pseudomonadota bacterium]|nr:cell wall hydrolase [Pseudomonadota bacterium]